MQAKILLIGISGALTVMLGAFAAHGLEPHLSDYQKEVFETASDYQFYHTLALLGIVLLAERWNSKLLNYTVNFFLVGILLFSGSLYLLACADVLGIANYKFILGPITPIGGTCFIIGWGLLCFSAVKGSKTTNGVQ